LKPDSQVFRKQDFSMKIYSKYDLQSFDIIQRYSKLFSQLKHSVCILKYL